METQANRMGMTKDEWLDKVAKEYVALFPDDAVVIVAHTDRGTHWEADFISNADPELASEMLFSAIESNAEAHGLNTTQH